MLIVSQNKKMVLNLNIIESVSVSDESGIEICGIWTEAGNCTLYNVASYENESKAKRVLEQLWSAYANGHKVFIMPEK